MTRNLAIYRDMASFVLNELKQVGVEASLRSIDTVEWFWITSRKDFQIGANISGYGVDDPDSNSIVLWVSAAFIAAALLGAELDRATRVVRHLEQADREVTFVSGDFSCTVLTMVVTPWVV